MPMLKLYQLATPTSATQVTTTGTSVRQVTLSASAGATYSYGDKSMTTAATGIVVPASASPIVLGSVGAHTSFDLTELYVIAATGNVNVLAVLW